METKGTTTIDNALGYVSETKTGFEGALAMMNLSAAIRIEKNAEKAAAVRLRRLECIERK